ncbi:MAG TPA: hypothetical protein ENN40_10830 [Candidatus Aminicenantes bacterium]|nr:hypothetical protein [Candidatus Aminicenantes bacterium]
MKEGLDVLFSLQQTDDRLKEIQLTLKDIPRMIRELEEERDGKAEIIEAAREKLQANTKSRQKMEREIQAIKEKIAKYREQMAKASTNREYQGFIAEIKFEENLITQIEEKLIEHMVESDEIVAEIRSREEDFQKIVAEYNQRIKDFNTSLEYEQKKLAEVRKERESIRARIPARLLKVYDNLFAKKAGKVISLVESDFCGVCNIKVRPQLLSELISTDGMFVCENCGRILFKRVEKEADKQPASSA